MSSPLSAYAPHLSFLLAFSRQQINEVSTVGAILLSFSTTFKWLDLVLEFFFTKVILARGRGRTSTPSILEEDYIYIKQKGKKGGWGYMGP